MVYFYNNFLLLSLWFNKAFSRMLLSLSEIFFCCSHMLKCLNDGSCCLVKSYDLMSSWMFSFDI